MGKGPFSPLIGVFCPYIDDTPPLTKVKPDCPDDAKRVLIAGRNSGLEALLQYFGHHRVPIAPDGKLLPTATVAHLQIDSNERQFLDGQIEEMR